MTESLGPLLVLLAFGACLAVGVGALFAWVIIGGARDRARDARIREEAAARAQDAAARAATEAARAAELLDAARARFAALQHASLPAVDPGSVILPAGETALWSASAEVLESSRRAVGRHEMRSIGVGPVVLSSGALVANGLRLPFGKIVQARQVDGGVEIHLDWATRPLVFVELSEADAWFLAAAVPLLARRAI